MGAQGFSFTPMVVDSHSGAWSPTARKTLDRVAKTLAMSWNDQGESTSLKLAQRLSITLHRENARAVMKRMGSPLETQTPSGWDLYDESWDD